MEERERRIGRNEAVFREANERIQELNQIFATFTDELVSCASAATASAPVTTCRMTSRTIPRCSGALRLRCQGSDPGRLVVVAG
jgi:hypothetical protein